MGCQAGTLALPLLEVRTTPGKLVTTTGAKITRAMVGEARSQAVKAAKGKAAVAETGERAKVKVGARIGKAKVEAAVDMFLANQVARLVAQHVVSLVFLKSEA